MRRPLRELRSQALKVQVVLSLEPGLPKLMLFPMVVHA